MSKKKTEVMNVEKVAGVDGISGEILKYKCGFLILMMLNIFMKTASLPTMLLLS